MIKRGKEKTKIFATISFAQDENNCFYLLKILKKNYLFTKYRVLVRLVKKLKGCNILFKNHFFVVSECFLYPSFLFSEFLKQFVIVTINITLILNLNNCVLYNKIVYNRNKLKELKKSNNLQTITAKEGGVFSIRGKIKKNKKQLNNYFKNKFKDFYEGDFKTNGNTYYGSIFN